MDPLAVKQIKIREIIESLEDLLADTCCNDRKASLKLKTRLARMRRRLAHSQSGHSRKTAHVVLAAIVREVVSVVIELGIEAFILSARSCFCLTQSNLASRLRVFALRAA
jgi:hypothetical protein